MARETPIPLKDLLFSFNGRIRRRDWWVWSIAVGLSHYVVSDTSALLLGLDAHVFSRGGREAVFGDPLLPLAHSLIVTLLFLWPQLALAAKRAHDRAASAWPALIVTLFLLAVTHLPLQNASRDGSYIPFESSAALIIAGATMVGSLYLLIVLGFMDGTPGPNRFGRSPKGIGGDTAQATAEVFE